MDSADKEEDYGLIRPSLIKSLRSILDQYPDDGQILKELLQNAEDAGATKVQFLYDGHTYGKTKLHHPQMASFQGPALFAYNDALFKEQDWQGIRMLQDSIKEKDPMKVGRFGLGFKSVLHMTDLPSVLSGDRVFVIDPHEKFFTYNGDRTTGYRWHLQQKKQEIKKIPDQFKPYKGKFNCSDDTFNTGYFNGTMFRFPLRTVESPLSDTLYDGERIGELFNSFEADAHLLLLFLKNVQSVELLTRSADQPEPEVKFKVALSETYRKFVSERRQEFSESVKNFRQTEVDLGSKSVTYPIVIETESYENGNVKEKKSYTWLVNEYFAGNEVSAQLKPLLSDPVLSYVPLVGTAMALKTEKLKQQETASVAGDSISISGADTNANATDDVEFSADKPSGQVYCFLPLPVEQKSPTGLPVHVNGYFSISQNRRHLKWPTYGQHYRSDKLLLWNHCLLEELVPRSYTELVDQAVIYAKRYPNLVSPVDVYNAVPNLIGVDEKWQVLLEPLLMGLLTHPIFHTKANGGQWLRIGDCIVDCMKDDSDMKNIVVDTLIQAGVSVIQIPMHVLMAVGAYCDRSLEEISPSLVRTTLQKSEIKQLRKFSAEEKLLLLKYILKDGDFNELEGIELLPVDSEGQFIKFDSSADSVLIATNDCPKELLPGLEKQILCTSLEDTLQKKMLALAKSRTTQLTILDADIVISLLHKILPKEWSSQDVVTLNEDSMVTYNWLEELWKFLRTHYPSDLSVVSGHPVLPLDDNCKNTKLVPIMSPSTVVCQSAMGTDLPPAVCEVLSKIGVHIVAKLPQFVSMHAAVMGNYVHLPLPHDVVESMAIVCRRSGPTCYDILRTDITREQRSALVTFLAKISLGELSMKLVTFLKSLPLFQSTTIPGTDQGNMTGIVSVQEVNKAIPKHDLPITLEEPYLCLESEDEIQVGKLLGVTFTSTSSMLLDSVLPNIKSRSYDNDQIQKIMGNVLENLPVLIREDPQFYNKLSEIPFVMTEKGELETPGSLFDPELEILKDMFSGQNVFPGGLYLEKEKLAMLRKMGMKGVLDISARDVLYSAFSLDKMASEYQSSQGTSVDGEDKSYPHLHKKGMALLKFLSRHSDHLQIETNGKILSDWLTNMCWMPILKEKPELFPPSLPWKGNEIGIPVGKPKDIMSYEWGILIGSHKAVAIKRVPIEVSHALKWVRDPDVCDVLKQLKTVVEKYEPAEKAQCLALLIGLYDHLSTINPDDLLQELENLGIDDWVWQGDGFTSISKVFFKRQFTDLRPYIFPMPSELEPFHAMFKACGMQQSCPEHTLIGIIKDVAHRYSTERNEKQGISEIAEEQAGRDLLLVVDIINHLKGSITELSEEMLEQILVPTQPLPDQPVRFLPISDVTYCDTEWLRQGFDVMKFDEQDGITFIHDNVPVPTAQFLKVPTLMSRMLHAEELDITGFGQSEPLTDRVSQIKHTPPPKWCILAVVSRRLKRLLEDYTDGLAIPKELIQNADDAHATKVRFMFDERSNQDHMKFLIDEGMKDCQGPALWVYNNAVFTDNDFDNIVKLGGATKEKDIDKIGKFGLGFNAVYNITDVPSFISRNNIVIFDPHTTHLGRGIHDRSKPGIKIDMHKNKTLIRKLPDQFKPYDGIFGCEIGAHASGSFDGTLFRLPLRSRQQSANSQICNIHYDSKEVIQLLGMTIRNANNLLLFTQNVLEVEFYHLQDGGDPKNAELLFSIRKEPIKIIRELKCKLPKLPQNADLDKNELELIQNSNFLTAVSEYQRSLAKMTTSRVIKVPQIPQSSMAIKTLPKMTDKGHALLSIRNAPLTEYWLISSCMGQEKSLAFAKQQSSGEFIPIAGVALPLKLDENNGCFLPQSYNRGVAFCYLPLPMPVGLPVHVNGTFAIQSSRRCLFEKSDDDKHNLKYQWNQILIEDAIVHAYLQMLCDLNVLLPPDIDISLYKIWPSAHAVKPYFKSLLTSFYSVVANSPQMTITRSGKDLVSFGSAVFLDPAFSDSVKSRVNKEDAAEKEKKVIHAAVEVFSRVVQDKTIITVPESFFVGFKQTGYSDIIKEKTYDVLRFFSEIFFPNIDVLDAKTRDTLLIFALGKQNDDVDNLIRRYNCIAVTPDGSRLRKPNEVVYPTAVAAKMYVPEDERFPYGDMAEGQVLKNLRRLDMIVNELDWDDLYDRAESVINQYEIGVENGRIRLYYVIAAIDRKLSSTQHRSKTPHQQENIDPYEQKKLIMAEKFKTLQFLPTAKKPVNFPVKWLGYSEGKDEKEWCPSLMSAQDMFPYDLKYMVSATQPILDEQHMTHRVKTFLGMGNIDPMPDHVITQFEHALQVNLEDLQLESYEEAIRVFYGIYKYLQDVCIKDIAIAEMIHNAFSSRECIIINKYLVKPEHVASVYPYRGAPYLFGLPDNMARRFQKLMQIFGVRERFDVKDFVQALGSIHEKYGDRKMDLDHVEVSVTLVAQLNTSMRNNNRMTSKEVEDKYGTIYLPSAGHTLQPASTLCYNDCPWLPNTETMNFTHQGITLNSSDRLGVKTKRQEALQKHATGIPFGQKERLVNSLNRLLTNYPLDQEVLKELIQNADDAGATEIHFILDPRQHADKHVFEDKWKPLQGPALLVYNNRPFLQEDLEAIQRLGEGSKGHDPTTTGQYGIGFSSVYHLTDAPCILTTMPGHGTTLCVFDPQCAYVPGATTAEPGMRYENIDELKTQFGDVFQCFLEEQINTSNGTLFRFPLRTSAMAEKSMLSTHVVTPSKILRIMRALKDEIFDILLFTNNIAKVKISQVNAETGYLQPIYEAVSKMTESDVQLKKTMSEAIQEAKEVLKKPDFTLQDIAVHNIMYTQFLMDSNQNQERWCVAQRLGVSDDAQVSPSIEQSIKNGHLVVLPRGGVAYMIDKRSQNSLIATPRKRKVFCILPLPVETELSVHINGHFALGYENRRQLATAAEGEYKHLWNMFLLENVIAAAYIKLLEGMRASVLGEKVEVDENITVVKKSRKILDAHLKMHQNAFPDFVEKEPQWNCLVRSVYEMINHIDAPVIPCLKEITAPPEENDQGEFPVEETWQVLWLPPAGKGAQKAFFTSVDEEEKEARSGLTSLASSASVLQTGIKSIKGAFGWLRGGATTSKDEGSVVLPVKPDSQILKEVLQDCGFKILEASKKVVENLARSDVKVDFMSPEGVLQFFGTYDSDDPVCHLGQKLPVPLKDTPLADSRTLSIILKYCQKMSSPDEFFGMLKDLPLLLTNDGMLRVFDIRDPMFLSKYCDLVPNCGDKFLHHSMQTNVFKDLDPNDTFLFRTFEVEDLADMLEDHLPQAEYFGKQDMVPWNKHDTVINEEWIMKLWSFLADRFKKELDDPNSAEEEKGTKIREGMSPLNEWSLVPACKGDSFHLVSVENAYKVISFHKYDNKYLKVKEILESLNPAILDLKAVSTFHARDIRNLEVLFHHVSTLERPEAVLGILHHMISEELVEIKLTQPQCTVLLKYFNSHIEILAKDEDNKAKLRDLPLFTTIYKDVIKLSNCFVYTLPSRIPTAGVEVWQSKSGTVFLERQDELEPLYDFIECKPITAEEVYCTFIFQHFEYFNREERMEHLYHVYNRYVKDGSTGFESDDEKKHFMDTLKDLPFIEDRDGDLQPPNAFYDPENVVFGIMMEQCEFPPKPTNLFKDGEWYIFLRKLGLVKEVTEEMYLNFTKSVATEGSDPNSPGAEMKSKVLCEHLYGMQSEERDDIMQKISEVPFIAPSKCPVALTKLYPQHGDYGTGKLAYIPLKNSIPKTYENIAWTTANILPDWADPMKRRDIHDDEKATIVESVGIQKEPSLDIVVAHVKHLCDDPVEPTRLIPQIRKSVFKNIYEYLQQHCNDNQTRDSFEALAKIPCIVVEDGRQLVCPDQTVFNIYEEIKPYLYKVPIDLGEYQELFRHLGATEREEAKQYATVLEKMKDIVGTSKLNPNEMRMALKAMKGYFKTLELREAGSNYELYLPSEKGHLVPSYRLVFNDAPAYYERVQGIIHSRFMVDLRECGMKNKQAEDTVCLIPKDKRPLLLSNLVVESLDHTAKVSSEGVAVELEKKIKSDEFKGAVARLIRHGMQKAGQKVDVDEMYDVIDRLSTLNIHGIDSVQTHLKYEEKDIANSEANKACFVTSKDAGIGLKKWSIFIKKDASLDQELLIPLAEVINTILSGMLKDCVLYLLPILSCEAANMHKKLNSLNIKRDHNEATGRYTVLPQFGSKVSQDHHSMLDQNFTELLNEEIVAYREDGADDGDLIYATIKEEIEGPPDVKSYLIRAGNECDEVIIADSRQLYKFIRK